MHFSPSNAVLLLGLVVAAGSRPSSAIPAALEPFTGIRACANGALGIKSGSNYTVEYRGNPDLFRYYSATVREKLLYVENSAYEQRDSQGVTVLVTMPSDALEELILQGNGAVSVVKGFDVPSFTLDSSGNGEISADLTIANKLTIVASGNGAINVQGSSGSLDLSSSGNGAVRITGIQGNADLDLSGNGATYIGGSRSTEVSGTSDANGALKYTGASCDVSFSNFWSSCSKVAAISQDPVLLPTPGTVTSSGAGKCSST
jgi:hypothetical protein